MRVFFVVLLSLCSLVLHAEPSPAALSVWANEAIVATYTYDYQHYLESQKKVAHYFTATGWIEYSKALINSKIMESVEKNKYFVSAVATSPPQISLFTTGVWKAQMPLLVVYRNPQFEQKQTLLVTIIFKQVGADMGVRGLAIDRLLSEVKVPACSCDIAP